MRVLGFRCLGDFFDHDKPIQLSYLGDYFRIYVRFLPICGSRVTDRGHFGNSNLFLGYREGKGGFGSKDT
jgi:hypothetical protein